MYLLLVAAAHCFCYASHTTNVPLAKVKNDKETMCALKPWHDNINLPNIDNERRKVKRTPKDLAIIPVSKLHLRLSYWHEYAKEDACLCYDGLEAFLRIFSARLSGCGCQSIKFARQRQAVKLNYCCGSGRKLRFLI